MGEPEGERMTMPVPFSQVEANTRRASMRIEAKIIDTGFAQLLMAPWSMMMAAGYSREIEQRLREGDHVSAAIPAIEKWNKNAKNGEIDVLVGKRFMVTIEGHELDDIKHAAGLRRRTSICRASRGG